MKSTTTVIFFVLGLLAISSSYAGQENEIYQDSISVIPHVYSAPIDTTNVTLKKFSSEAIDALKSDPDFNYKQPPTVAESLWDRFTQWLRQLFSSLLDGAASTDWGRVLLYTVALVGLVIIVMVILRVNAFRIFYSGADRGSASTSVFHENIHEMDFEKLGQEAIDQQKYREGVRLIFLHALKLLTDKQFIHWQAGKTNHDYVNELTTGELKTNFNELSFYFNYAWYGNFIVNEETFRQTQQLFHSLKTKTSSSR